ncbi:hypothetical protein [Flaviaesturariibacter amylovorans]|uniref:hypothetical protein n=1 Tax=Flaviaesturariibacter amylovorans TaxID=1084520 RepID=UPI0031E61032
MLRTVFILSVPMLVRAAGAQRPIETGFATWYESAPLPAAGIGATQAAYATIAEDDRRFGNSHSTVSTAIGALLACFQECLEGKSAAATPEERRLLDQYRRSDAGFSGESRLRVFAAAFEGRLLAAAQKYPWDRPAAPLGTRAGLVPGHTRHPSTGAVAGLLCRSTAQLPPSELDPERRSARFAPHPLCRWALDRPPHPVAEARLADARRRARRAGARQYSRARR